VWTINSSNIYVYKHYRITINVTNNNLVMRLCNIKFTIATIKGE